MWCPGGGSLGWSGEAQRRNTHHQSQQQPWRLYRISLGLLDIIDYNWDIGLEQCEVGPKFDPAVWRAERERERERENIGIFEYWNHPICHFKLSYPWQNGDCKAVGVGVGLYLEKSGAEHC